jgi:hypothetical protein
MQIALEKLRLQEKRTSSPLKIRIYCTFYGACFFSFTKESNLMMLNIIGMNWALDVVLYMPTKS